MPKQEKIVDQKEAKTYENAITTVWSLQIIIPKLCFVDFKILSFVYWRVKWMPTVFYVTL